MKLFDATGMLTQKMMTAFGNTGERAVSTHGHGHQWFRSGTVRLRRSGSPHWTASGGITTYSVYDGAQVIADVTAGGALLRSYTWGPGIDNLLALTVHTGTTARTYYAIKDHLGSVHALVDAAGSIVEQYRFDAWGRTTVYDGVGTPLAQSAIGNRCVWQGREISWSTGLYYFRARWYDPVTGRWLSNDLIGVRGGLNQYVFCGTNPANFVDPFGQCADGQKSAVVIASGTIDKMAARNVANHLRLAGWYVSEMSPDAFVNLTTPFNGIVLAGHGDESLAADLQLSDLGAVLKKTGSSLSVVISLSCHGSDFVMNMQQQGYTTSDALLVGYWGYSMHTPIRNMFIDNAVDQWVANPKFTSAIYGNLFQDGFGQVMIGIRNVISGDK